MTTLFRRWIVFFCMAASASGQARIPEPNPPFVPGPGKDLRRSQAPSLPGWTAAPTTEWTLHKTPDGIHPDGSEQQMVWLMNRARRRPSIEGIWLAHLRQSNVQGSLNDFHVQRDVLLDEFSVRAASSPAAFDARLYLAASNHSAYLISIDGQNHSNQFDRVAAQGFHFTMARGSVFSYSQDAIYGHAGFNVDWGGDDGTGMQTGRGHREGVMGDGSSVGIACVPETNAATDVGPLVTTINYCNASTSYSNHYNQFIVGTVWNDLNTNGLYDPGEGLGSVTAMPDKGAFYAVTGSAGGYAIPANSDVYALTFSGGALPSNFVKTVVVDAASVLVDCPVHSNPPEAQATMAASADWTLTYTLSGQRKGRAYRLSTCTDLMSGNWVWAGILPSGYDDTLTYSAPLIDTNVPQRFTSLQGWAY